MNRKSSLTACAALAFGLFFLRAQPPAAVPAIFTAAQAEAGRIAAENTCGKCHTPGLLGRTGASGEFPPLSALSPDYQKFIGPRGWVPPLAGKAFIDKWGSKTASELIARFQETVPYFLPEHKDDETTVNITAYILQMNGAQPGSVPLTRSTGAVVRSVTKP